MAEYKRKGVGAGFEVGKPESEKSEGESCSKKTCLDCFLVANVPCISQLGVLFFWKVDPHLN